MSSFMLQVNYKSISQNECLKLLKLLGEFHSNECLSFQCGLGSTFLNFVLKGEVISTYILLNTGKHCVLHRALSFPT